MTGRPETRRTFVEWVEVLMSSLALGLLAVAVLLMTCTLTLRAMDSRLAPPGERYWVDGDKYQIHLFCNGNKTTPTGAKATTVIFEGGEDPVEYGLWQFADNAILNGSISRYCFADRPGMAWSDAAPSPLSVSTASDVLGETLSRAGEEGPWVLVSAGIGSLYSRVFSSRHGRDVRGILMIDPLHGVCLSEPLLFDRVADNIYRGLIGPCWQCRTRIQALAAGRYLSSRVSADTWCPNQGEKLFGPDLRAFCISVWKHHFRQTPGKRDCQLLDKTRRDFESSHPG